MINKILTLIGLGLLVFLIFTITQRTMNIFIPKDSPHKDIDLSNFTTPIIFNKEAETPIERAEKGMYPSNYDGKTEGGLVNIQAGNGGDENSCCGGGGGGYPDHYYYPANYYSDESGKFKTYTAVYYNSGETAKTYPVKPIKKTKVFLSILVLGNGNLGNTNIVKDSFYTSKSDCIKAIKGIPKEKENILYPLGVRDSANLPESFRNILHTEYAYCQEAERLF